MDIRTFGDLSTRILECFHDETYSEAKGLIDRYGDQFPEERWHVDYWRMILSALAGDCQAANQVLKQAVEDGRWWPERYLDQEEFTGCLDQALLDKCYQRRDIARSAAKPQLVTRHPAEATLQPPLLFVVHRNHSNISHEGARWQPAVERGWGLALPQSSQLVGRDIHVWDDRDIALAEFRLHAQNIRGQAAFDLERVVMAGYITGGNLAIRLTLNSLLGARGFIALSPYIPDLETAFMPLLHGRNLASLRGVVTIGQLDSRCYPGAIELVDHLRAAGATIDLREYPDFTQGYPPDFDSLLQEARDFILN